MKARAFPLLLVVGPHANSRLGLVEGGRGLRELSDWLREREARLRAEKRLPNCREVAPTARARQETPPLQKSYTRIQEEF